MQKDALVEIGVDLHRVGIRARVVPRDMEHGAGAGKSSLYQYGIRLNTLAKRLTPGVPAGKATRNAPAGGAAVWGTTDPRKPAKIMGALPQCASGSA